MPRRSLHPATSLLALGLVGLGATACYLPFSSAAPQSATTVGKGRVGGTVYSEFPTVDLLASQTSSLKSDVALAPLPTVTLQGAIGLTDSLDLEVGVDGVLYIVLPMPLGISGGLRYQLVRTDNVALALAGRIGGVGFGLSDKNDTSGKGPSVSAFYTDATLAMQLTPDSPVRPGLALSYIPTEVHNSVTTDTPTNFAVNMVAATVSLTFAINRFQLGPFGNFVYFASDPLGQRGIATFGFMMAIRPNPRAEQADRPIRLDVPPPAPSGPPGTY